MICTKEQILSKIKGCIKPHLFLSEIGYFITHNETLTPVKVLVYEDAKGNQFARQSKDNFVLPLQTYRKEILGDFWVDNNQELKEPLETANYFFTRSKRKTCNILNNLYK